MPPTDDDLRDLSGRTFGKLKQNKPYWADTGETGKFTRDNATADLSYILVDGIYHMEHLDE